jgi:hypothetical protein
MSAATYEGTGGNSDAAGGYAVSIPTEQLIVPLAMPDLGIFDASTVIPTATDIKVPQQASFGTSALKAESTGTGMIFAQDASGSSYKPPAFSIERKAGAPFNENRFWSKSPFTTADHTNALEELERIFRTKHP